MKFMLTLVAQTKGQSCQINYSKEAATLKNTNTARSSNRDGSRTAATSNMEHFVIIVNGFQPLTIIAKRSILGVAEF